MRTHETVRKATSGQRDDLCATFAQCIPEDLGFDDAQAIIGSKGPFMVEIRRVFAKYHTQAVKQAIVKWQTFYWDEFGADFALEGIKIPPQPEGFNFLMIIPPGITAEQVYQRCACYFPCWKDTESSLNDAFPDNDREPGKEGYAIWLRKRQINQPNNEPRQENRIQYITVLERLVYELSRFKETGKHKYLDLGSWTHCLGSRDSGGNVADVYWTEGVLHVTWYYAEFAGDSLPALEVSA